MDGLQLVIDGKVFEVKEVLYSQEGIEGLLRASRENDFQEVYMPQLIEGLISAPDHSAFVGKTFYTYSLKIAGNVSGAQAYDVYVHIPTYFTEPANVRDSTTILSRDRDPIGWDTKQKKRDERLRELKEVYNRRDNKAIFAISSMEFQYTRDWKEPVDTQKALQIQLTEAVFGGKERAERFFRAFGINEAYARYTDDLTGGDCVDVGFLRITIENGFCRYEAVRPSQLGKGNTFMALREVK